MTPGQRLAKEVRTRIKLPGAKFDDLLPLCESILRKPRSPASRYRPDTNTKPARKAALGKTHKQVRAECVARASQRCEYTGIGGRCFGAALIWDHFWGRGKDETAEGSWMLCEAHNHLKTDWVGGRAEWLHAFWWHCFSHRYQAQMEKANAAIILELAQHPEAQSGNQPKEG